MQIIDNKYRLFGVINLIDLAVVLALLAGGYAVYKVLSPGAAGKTAKSGTTKTVEYVLYAPSLRNFSSSQLKVGDPVYKVSGTTIGKITAGKAKPTTIDIFDVTSNSMRATGSAVATDVYVTVVGQGQPTPTGVVVADLLLHAGQTFPFMTPTFQSDVGSIADMKIAGE